MPRGLSEGDIARLRREHGWNELPEAPPASPLALLAHQFTDLLVLLLIAAAGISLAIGEMADFIAIIAVVILNAVLGFIQEWRAETTMQALRAMLSPTAIVLRDGAPAMQRAHVHPWREVPRRRRPGVGFHTGHVVQVPAVHVVAPFIRFLRLPIAVV